MAEHGSVCGFKTPGTGPVFIMEPTSKVDITSRSKGVVINCLVHGDPEPAVSWHYKDGKPINDRSEDPGRIFRVLANNSLHVKMHYDSDSNRQQEDAIQASEIKCKAANKFGTIVSAPVQINGGRF